MSCTFIKQEYISADFQKGAPYTQYQDPNGSLHMANILDITSTLEIYLHANFSCY